jgi:nucleotide-binding universal stress UspA family protein
MADVILAVLARVQDAASVLGAARCLAGLLGSGNVHALAVGSTLPGNPLLAESLIAEAEEAVAAQQRDRARVAALQRAFEEWRAGEAGLAAHWHADTGAPGDIVEARGRRADYVVIARPMPDDDAAARQAFHAALFDTDRPVLVVPPDHAAPFGRFVAIAWRDDGRAVRAVVPALRFLGRAERLHLITGVRPGSAEPGVPEVVSEHGVHAELHILPIGEGPFGKAMLAKAHALGADLLVMGAYAHTPLREAILGGMTRYMLSHADLPLLMRH